MEWNRADHATTIPLRDMPRMPVKEGHHEGPPLRLLPRKGGPSGAPAGTADTALQTLTISAPSVGNVTSFPGVGDGDYGFVPNAAPPDTNLAVGATQVVQWVNESFAVFSKSGTLLAGPTAGNTVFQALGSTHPCAVHNDGDPIAQYDKLANRWILTQFSVTSGSSQGYWQCVAVSQTSDATGAYNVYAFNYGTVQFIDYPKLGVWNTAYLVTYNVFNNGQTFAGPKLCAFDRSSMLAGAAATQICFQLSTAFGGVLPSDIDGTTAPPSGSTGFFVDFGTNDLELWQISNINFTNGTATLNGPTTIPVAAFSPACNGNTCIPQSGTNQQLDSLGDRLMYRLAYRNFGDHEALVVNHSIVSGTSVGVRWYEVRSPTAPTLFQQGTFAPDANFRWMGSMAMDHAGNIAVGYSVSSSSLNPGIRFTGRAPSDPAGTLGTELTITNGGGSQTGGLNRWGDYSAMSVDPVDDCTMWYTTEYEKVSGSFNWSTTIANFKFSTCGNPDYSVSATPASQTVTQGNSTSYTVTVTPTGGFTGTVTLSASGLPANASATFNPPSVTTSGTSTMTVTTASTTPTGSFPLTITGTSTTTHTTSVTLVVNAPVVGDFSISAAPASATVTAGNGTSYTATVTGSGGFTGNVTFSASGLPAGASASFNPTSVTGSGSSTMSVTTSTTTPAGTYTLTITGTSGSLVHSTTVTLVVNPAPVPDFTISASPATLTVSRNSSGSYTVTVSAVNGFNGTVSLSVSGLGSRVSATFNPSSVTGSGTSTLTVTVNRKATVGNRTLTITGTSGSLTHSTNVTLTIQ
ncbi:MAG TPA: hypothetical protein VJA94_13545 [Candidatus Angelobacter sp.]